MRLLFPLYFLVIFGAFGADTLKLNFNEAESRFITKNLLIIASRYDASIADELIRQARLWANPTLNIEQNLYNQYTKRVLDAGPTGQNVVQVEQLIRLAGKRNKEITLQKYAAQITAYQVAELVRSLRLEFTQSYYDLYFTSKKLRSISTQAHRLSVLTENYENQFRKGNVSLKEVSRLKSLLITLQSDVLENKKTELELQFNLKTLLSVQGDTIIEPIVENENKDFLPKLPLNTLTELALENRPDYKSILVEKDFLKSNIALQKAYRIPDINVGILYDRAGSYIQNYWAATLSTPIPIFNRNQAGIKIAEYEWSKYRELADYKTNNIINNLVVTAQKTEIIESFYSAYSKLYIEEITKLQQAIVDNYEKKNISLTEFVDFYESNISNILSYFTLSADRFKAYEELNFAIGKKIIQ